MNREDIEELIEEYDLGNDAFIIHHLEGKSLTYKRASLTRTYNGGGDYYEHGDTVQISLDNCLGDSLQGLLERFCAIVFDNGNVHLCEDSWDGYQPIVTFYDYYNISPLAGLEGIF